MAKLSIVQLRNPKIVEQRQLVVWGSSWKVSGAARATGARVAPLGKPSALTDDIRLSITPTPEAQAFLYAMFP